MVITFELCVIWLWKKQKRREFYWLSFALDLSFAKQKCAFYGLFTGAEEKYFFSKNWNQMCRGKIIDINKAIQHELATW